MPHLEQAVKYEPLPSYPHLGQMDIDIWTRFLEKNPTRFSRVWYDFRVGDEELLPEDWNPRARAGYADLTRWRIDVVAEDETAIYIIELKPHANAKALGQVSAYAELYEAEQRPSKPVIPVLLTDLIISTTQKLAKSWAVELWEV